MKGGRGEKEKEEIKKKNGKRDPSQIREYIYHRRKAKVQSSMVINSMNVRHSDILEKKFIL